MRRDRNVQPSVPLPQRGTTELVKRQPRQLGRPLSGDSEETRQHIRRGARRCFATCGYAATSNRLIVEETATLPSSSDIVWTALGFTRRCAVRVWLWPAA
jgi:hypothetical protein